MVLFAVGLLFAVCLHEAGHMVMAKAFGMKVTQYFAGFGPTVWSFRRGETEYGVKAVPAGGFVKIVGMTPLEPVEPGDEGRAFFRRPLWQRTVVLSAGSITHFLLAAVVTYVAAVTTGLPNIRGAEHFSLASAPPVVQAYCVPASTTATSCAATDPAPAKQAGMQTGDLVTAVGSTRVSTYEQLVHALQALPAGPVGITVDRAGAAKTLTVTPVRVQRTVDGVSKQVSAIGVTLADSAYPAPVLHFGALSAFGGSATFGQEVVSATFSAMAAFPGKVPKLVDALEGHPRDPNTPVSVVGASRIGGEAVSSGHTVIALTAFAQLNVFIGIFNLVPLLPLDGGHVAVAWFEAVRSRVARRRGLPDPGRVDYNKLMPVTYAVILVFGLTSLLAVAADIVNPIRLN
ncbi:RIP metalloprotease RseP [Motilibacter rhizosphaerae]|uniref:RIP metalloprotease RseP n=1 Tax=Motilibacter rhizosphaerae TaxID=598652 RepID=A0A4Q7NPR8_9ACTN|nr:RIP metalloprotease RseP [Motilibacter rhizosphaerae]